MTLKTASIYITNITCSSCEKKIEKNLKELKGVNKLSIDTKTDKVTVSFDGFICNENDIINSLKSIGYCVSYKPKKKINDYISIGLMIFIAFIILFLSNNSGNFNISESLSSNSSFLVLFIIGILSSFHCVGMCGGLMLSQSISIKDVKTKQKLKPTILYNLGRLSSYTLIGGIIGSIGSVFSLSFKFQALISIISGIFMVFMGINIFGIQILHKLKFKLPFIKLNIKHRTPFIVGFLNGFIPCGPLQAMQIYALGTGSLILGATSMFFFALGTIPLMLVFGTISSLLTASKTKFILKVSGVIVFALGISMTNRGLNVLGLNSSPNNNISSNNIQSEQLATLKDNIQTIKIKVTSSGYTPNNIYVQKGIKTRLIIEGETINSCNNEIIFPNLGITKTLESGENIIEFIPYENINYSCWMGMLTGNINVVDNLNNISDESLNQNYNDNDNEYSPNDETESNNDSYKLEENLNTNVINPAPSCH